MSGPRKFPAPAKINWHLAVGGRRPDGFHAVASLFETIALCDTLEISAGGAGGLTLRAPAGIPADARNTIAKADAALRKKIPGLPALSVALEKNVPHEAGLGGGSSDAAAYLLAVNSLLGLALDEAALRELALAAGSDAPFFVRGGRAAATGRGERLRWLEDAPPVELLLVMPAAKSPTAEAYRALNRPPGDDASAGPVPEAADPRAPRFLRALRNDFEPVMPAAVRAPIDEMRALGGIAFLSGSGAASCGRFPDAASLAAAESALRGRHPLVARVRTLPRTDYLAQFA